MRTQYIYIYTNIYAIGDLIFDPHIGKNIVQRMKRGMWNNEGVAVCNRVDFAITIKLIDSIELN